VITAPQAAEVTFALDNERPAMRAHVRETSKLGSFVRHKNQGLVQTSVEQRKGQDMTGCLYSIGVTRPLPASSEYRIFLQIEVVRIGINRGWKSRSARDVFVDLDWRKRGAAPAAKARSFFGVCLLAGHD
jgi:hypothetical protein